MKPSVFDEQKEIASLLEERGWTVTGSDLKGWGYGSLPSDDQSEADSFQIEITIKRSAEDFGPNDYQIK